MTNFIIDPKSVSYIEIRNNLLTYFNSLPDAGEWSLFLSSSAGARIIDLLAAVASFNKFDTITARREGFQQFATNRSSIIGKAQDFGYSSYRGRNKVIKLTIIPSTTGVWPKYMYLGSVKDKFLVLESSTVVNAGTQIQVNAIIGEVLTESLFATGVILNSYRFSQVDVSEDLRIFIDGTEISWGSEINDALDGKFQIQSNTFRSVDAKYLNLSTFATRYIIGSEIRLDYIPLKNTSYVNTDIKFYDSIGSLLSYTDVSLFSDVESDESIRINSPIKNETSNAVRGREDQPKIYRTLNADILDASGEDITDAVMKIYLLRSNNLTFSAEEKLAMQIAFEKYRPNGLLPPLLDDAKQSGIKLLFSIRLQPTSTTVPQTLVDSVLLPYKNKLGTKISVSDLENAVENDIGVKTARISMKASSWNLSTNYKVGDYVEPTTANGFAYRLSKIKSLSGIVEPTWPVIQDAEVTDNQIVWKAIPQNDLAGVANWSTSTAYDAGAFFGMRLGSIVRPTVPNGFVYEAVSELHFSSSLEPLWSNTIGSTTYDNMLLWTPMPIVGSPNSWSASSSYKIGDTVKSTAITNTIMFRCVNYLSLSNNVEPTWPVIVNNSVNDLNLVWLAQDKLQDIHSLNKNQYFIISNEIVVS